LLRHGQIKGANMKRFIGTTNVLLDSTGIAQAHYWEHGMENHLIGLRKNTRISSDKGVK